MFFQYDWGFSKPAMAVNFGFFERGQSFIYAFFAVINAYFILKSPFIRNKIGDFKGLIIINLVMGLGFFFASFKLGYLGIITMIVIEIAGVISEPWVSTIINDRISSTFRATTLSTLEMLGKLPFLLINLLGGIALDGDNANRFTFLWLARIYSSYIFILGKIQKETIFV